MLQSCILHIINKKSLYAQTKTFTKVNIFMAKKNYAID